MRIRPYLLLSILATLILLADRMPASDIPERESVPVFSDPTGTIRFDLYQGYFMVAHGSIGPLKNLNFFLDTGTAPSVLDSRIARKLDLKGEESTSIAVLGGRTQGGQANLPSIVLGPLKRANLQVITTDLSFFQKSFPVRIDAIVGMDVLGQSPFVIDYSARVIRVGPVPALAVSVPFRLYEGMPIFDVEIDHAPVHLLFDTGAGSIILFTKDTARSPGATDPATMAPQQIGDFESKQVWLRSLRLGRAEFRQKPAMLTRNPKPSRLDYDGLISPSALGISQVSVDLKGGVLAFRR
jgi:predicted aspartyl protease